ncbi:TRAP transporter 4TM/12TM fusion protein [Marinomonas alcarazii]|uniref:TRAP transporter 4TM/12TM fusion protein n=1 Tax=Marinomonas alcarazii TaxID=491949 RepID=A0A318V128_9GAMM|nr:TRAP transporter permease [Marinomonas alcarazii]PYF82462.1 TRAP transporter 4TM/12TM fusion protein [Marinomonas alcarazii]
MSQYKESSSSTDLDELVSSNDMGGRKPKGLQLKIILVVAFVWALFQLWIASPFPYLLETDLLRWNSNQARSIHLSFAIFLVFLSFPFCSKSPVDKIPLTDWCIAILASLCTSYYLVEYDSIATRVGAPILQDVIVASIGIPLLFEAARRSLGITLPLIAAIFLVYNFFGNYMPEMIAHKGFSLYEVVNHQWITTEGVFGIALGVSTDFVFLFVLFGALLDKAGAGNYFIQLAFSCLGHFRGGPAKAAVVASGLTGLISGSSIANVVTTGTFTIPMMKKVGFSSEKAGAVEVASSVNGQIMPPVMGAAAFLMVEYVGISYLDVIKHAFLPALISYIGLVYIVHLEALKANMQGLPRKSSGVGFARKLSSFLFGFLALCVLSVLVYFGLGWIKQLAGDSSVYVISILVILSYVGLLYVGSKSPKLNDTTDQDLSELPLPGVIFRSGIYYLLPVIVLVWCLMIERLSPGLSAFWAALLTIFMILTKPYLEGKFRKEAYVRMSRGAKDLFDGMVSGARNMASISIATATAGVIVGVVSQTSVGAVLADVVEVLSFGNITLMLILVAILCMILGMGLPTTANYIVVSSLMAGVIVDVGASNGLVVPLIAVHLFVFYFGLMADVTPPVGLASFAAAAVSGGKPIGTGIIAFKYALRTALLPFLFIFNSDLLLINVTVTQGVFIFVIATLAMLIFTAAMERYFIVKNKWWESALLLLIAFSIFRPGFWIDKVVEPYQYVAMSEFLEQNQTVNSGTPLRIHVSEEGYSGEPERSTHMLIARESGDAKVILEHAGLNLYIADSVVEVDSVGIGSDAYAAGFEAFQVLKGVDVSNDQPSNFFVYIPSLALLAGIVLLQRQRKAKKV